MNQIARDFEIASMDNWVRTLASRPNDVLTFQTVYDDSVISQLDPSFLAVDGRGYARNETREIGLFLRMFHSGLYQAAPLTGMLSPKFSAKAKISGSMFLDFIRGNHGYNVYFINPFPQNAYYTYNVWYHGDLAHPGLSSLAEILLGRAGYDTTLIYDARDTHATLLYSNYWVGDRRFWNGYMAAITRLMETLESMPRRLRDRYYEFADYRDWRSAEVVQVTYLTFILERMFSTFLHMNPGITALAYPFTREEILDRCYGGTVEREIVRSFGDIVDEIDMRRRYTKTDREVIFALNALRAAAVRHHWD